MDSACTALEEADKDGDVSNDGDVSKRAQKTPERLEYPANLLIMPEYMSQYGLLLQPAGRRLPNGYGNFIKELVQLLNDLNHPVMAGKRVGETAARPIPKSVSNCLLLFITRLKHLQLINTCL